MSFPAGRTCLPSARKHRTSGWGLAHYFPRDLVIARRHAARDSLLALTQRKTLWVLLPPRQLTTGEEIALTFGILLLRLPYCLIQSLSRVRRAAAHLSRALPQRPRSGAPALSLSTGFCSGVRAVKDRHSSSKVEPKQWQFTLASVSGRAAPYRAAKKPPLSLRVRQDRVAQTDAARNSDMHSSYSSLSLNKSLVLSNTMFKRDQLPLPVDWYYNYLTY